jgi:hypothetical protein
MDASQIEQSLRSSETGVIVVDERIVARVIKRHRELIRLGAPHAHNYWIERDALFQIMPPRQLTAEPERLPEHVVLLPRPKASELRGAEPADVLRWLWRQAFHAYVHLAIETLRKSGKLDEATIRARIDRIGQTEFDEIRRVLDADELIFPPGGDAEVYAEFVAVLLELHHFAPSLLARTFPTLRHPEQALAVVAEDIDVATVMAACKPLGAEDPKARGASKESTTPTYSALPALDLLPSFFSRRATTNARAKQLITQAAKARLEGNHVRSALLCLAALPAAGEEQELSLRTFVRQDFDVLSVRLDKALAPPDATEPPPPIPWTSSLLPLAVVASERQALRYPVEARLLYDLQRACTENERGASAVDLVKWALSLGKRPVVRNLPTTRALRIARHMRSALDKLRNAELPAADRRLLARLLRHAVKRAEDNVRATLRPVLQETLTTVGLVAESVPEQVASKKLVEELCDKAVSRGFLSIAELRDALSRNQLKLADVSIPRELVLDDALLRADKLLDLRLDGVYRRGEIYLRVLQKVSSVFFGTMLGRFATLYVILPIGGAFVALEGLAHMVGFVAKRLEVAPPNIVNWISVGITSVFIFGLLHSEVLRELALRSLSAVGSGLWAGLSWTGRRLVALTPVRYLMESGLARTIGQTVIAPLVVTLVLYFLTPLRHLHGAISVLGATAVFVAAAVFLNTSVGLVVQEAVIDQLARGWEMLGRKALPGMFRLILATFRAMLEISERMLYRVDEWLRFRDGEHRATIPIKAFLGLIWFCVAYVIRLYITLLIEPEINPLKHFPVVTVAQKMTLSIAGDIMDFLQKILAPLGPVIGGTIAGTTVFLFPSVFGFLVWELKENYRLYRKNRAHKLKPVPIGQHGETIGTLMRPGFHSGTLPKHFAKLRKAARHAELAESLGKTYGHSALRGLQQTLEDLKETIRRAVEREIGSLLAECPNFRVGSISVVGIELGSNRVIVELACDKLTKSPTVVAFEEQSGLLVASIVKAGFIDFLPDQENRILFENALAGFYRVAGVDLVREQIRTVLGEHVAYDISEEGLVVWPDEHYRTEVIYQLDSGSSDPIVEPVVRGETPKTAQKSIDLRKIMFRDQHITWADWVGAWGQHASQHGGFSRVLFGTSILPLPPEGSRAVNQVVSA